MSRFSKIFLLLFAVLLLILPDVLLYIKEDLLDFLFVISSRALLLISLGLVVISVTKSFHYTYLLVGIPYLISSVVEIIVVLSLDEYLTLDGAKALLFTNVNEIKDFASSFYWNFLLLPVVVLMYIAILKKLKALHYNNNSRVILSYSLVTLSVSIVISIYQFSNSPYKDTAQSKVKSIFKSYYLKQHPFNIYYRIYGVTDDYLKTSYKISKYNKQRESFIFNVSNIRDSIVYPDQVIVVIGEKVRYDNWSVNGYARETSPNLRKLKNLVSLQRHYSNANCTLNSIPLILTQGTPKTYSEVFTQKTFVSLFKEAGYRTSWIASQDIFSYINNREEPDSVIQLFKKNYRKDYHTDTDVIPVFESLITTQSVKKQLIVVNMLGGHQIVLPEKFICFKPNTSKHKYLLKRDNREVFINDYDNMILVEDFVISELIKLVKMQNRSSILLFIPDHGCDLFDSGNLFGYGTSVPTEKQLHIPLFIWASDRYIQNNSNKYKNLIKHSNLITTNDNIFYTISDLANIKYASFINNQSIADSSYVEPNSRFVYLNGEVIEVKNDK